MASLWRHSDVTVTVTDVTMTSRSHHVAPGTHIRSRISQRRGDQAVSSDSGQTGCLRRFVNFGPARAGFALLKPSQAGPRGPGNGRRRRDHPKGRSFPAMRRKGLHLFSWPVEPCDAQPGIAHKAPVGRCDTAALQDRSRRQQRDAPVTGRRRRRPAPANSPRCRRRGQARVRDLMLTPG